MNAARNLRWAVAVLTAPALLAACSNAPETKTALLAADGSPAGTVTFAAASGGTEVEVKLIANQAVKTGSFHGIHVHANDDQANGEGCKADAAMAAPTWFTAVDGHLKEGTATHSEHTGDFPSVLVAKDGTASLRFTTDRFTPAQVVGKAVILHANADNFGNIPTGTLPDQYTANAEGATSKTTATGNAGDRMACGLITRG